MKHFKTATSLSGLFYGAIALTTATLAGCGLSSATKVLDESTSAASQSLYYAFAGQPDVALTEQEISELQYAANYVQLDNQARVLVILGFDDNHSLQWISANQEVLTTSVSGRVLRTDSLLSNLEHVAQSEADPLHCLQFSASLEQTQSCQTQWQRLITTEHEGVLSQWRVETRFSVSETEGQREVLEEGIATGVSVDDVNSTTEQSFDIANRFEFSQYNGFYRAVASTQWISPELGMLEQQEVKAYSQYVSSDTVSLSNDAKKNKNMSNDADPSQINLSYDAFSLSNDRFLQDQIFAQPPELTNQQMWVRLERSNGTRVDIITEGEPRIAQLLDAVPTQQSVMWPQTKISNPALTQQFEARKQGMHVRLKMLAQTYRYDGELELASKADALADEFLTWPLKPSYVTNFSRAKARQDLSLNPLLNFAQVGEQRTANQPHYTISLSNTYDQSVLPTLPIADHDLPKGFRDVNAQLRLYMQYWNFEASAGAH